MIIYNSRMPKWFGFEGMVFIFIPCIFIVHSEKDCPAWLVEHEKVHLRQHKEWCHIPYLIVYWYDFFKGWWVYKDIHKAYMNIRFEKEAYQIASPPSDG